MNVALSISPCLERMRLKGKKSVTVYPPIVIKFLFYFFIPKTNNFKVNVKAEQKVSACYQSITFDVNISSYSVQSIASESS